MTFTPADPESMKGIRKAIQDIKLHDHEREDWFCMNLTSWLGERSGWLVARLDEAYAEIERLRRELAATVKAKQENDERFMIERDEARAQVKAASDAGA